MRASPANNHSLGSAASFSVRERSPHIAMDRVTRHISPSRHRSLRNESIEVVTPRIAQPYKTSLSAVTSPRIAMRPYNDNYNYTSSSARSATGSTKFQPLGIGRGASPTLKKSLTCRAKSHDGPRFWDQQVEETRQTTEKKDHRAFSCDALDGQRNPDDVEYKPEANTTPYLGGHGVVASGFDNRRLNPRYASTPTRLPKSPCALLPPPSSSSDRNDDTKYSRMHSNVSADTLDSVFAPASPRNFDGYYAGSSDPDQSFLSSTSAQHLKEGGSVVPPEEGDISKPQEQEQPPIDSGYVEGQVELTKCLEIEYVHIVDVTYERLVKDRKKKRLPQPNEETSVLVKEMMSKFEKHGWQDKPDSCPATPQGHHNTSSLSKKSGKGSSLGMKTLSSSITNFFRKITLSPKTSKKQQKQSPAKRPSKRSKSAGRLEGNRSVADSSSSLLGGYRGEISIDYSSMSSDTKGSVNDGPAAQDLNRVKNSPSRFEDMDTDTKENNTLLLLNDESSPSQNRAGGGGRMSRRDGDQQSGGGGSRSREMGSSSSNTRVYLKSIEDNTMTNRIDEKTVYKSFKEKQSPGYRRHTEAASMRSQALKAVEITERSLGGSTAAERRSSSTGGPTSPLVIDSTYYTESPSVAPQSSEARRVEDLNEVNRQAAFFGNQSKSDVMEEGSRDGQGQDENQPSNHDNTSHDSGSESSLSNSGNLLQEPPHTTHNASPKSHDNSGGHLQNGCLAEVHTRNKEIDQQKSLSYVKLSCSASGYNKYGKTATTTSLPKVSPASKDVTIATNNNITHNHPHNGLKMTVEGDSRGRTDDMYKPGGTNFVKGLSEKFESYNNNSKDTATAVSQPKQSRTDKRQNESKMPTRHSFVHNKVNSVSPHHYGPKTKSNNYGANSSSNSSSPSSSSSPAGNIEVVQTSGTTTSRPESEVVDSHNIDFRQARRAFSSHDKSADGGQPKSLSPGQHVPPFSDHGKAFESVGFSDRGKAFDNVVGAGSNIHTDLHLDLNGASRQNGLDEVDDTAFIRKTGGIIGTSELLLNGDINDDVVTSPSEIKVAAGGREDLGRVVEESLSRSNGSLDIGGSSGNVSLSSVDHQAAGGGSTGTLNSTSSSSVPSKDGKYYLIVVKNEEDRLNAHATRTEAYLQNSLSEEVLGKMRAAIGKAHLLTTKKFKQFRDLCHKNITQSSDEQFSTTCQDLAGFWDLVMIQVEDVYSLFAEIEKIRENGWKLEKSPEVQKSSVSTPTKSAVAKKSTSSTSSSCKATPKSSKSQQASKAREEARRRLLEAKKAGRHMRKASENEDVEIYIA